MALREEKPQISLYKALKAGYTRDLEKQQKALKRYGFIVDKELTNAREHVVAYNPNRKKLLYISQGTDPTSIKDIATDLALGVGQLKSTARYKEEKEALDKARAKYQVGDENLVVAGHSLGGSIANYITPSGAKAYTYNPAYTPAQKVRENVTNIRMAGDIFSRLAPEETTKTLANTSATEFGDKSDILLTHGLEGAKQSGVFF